MPRRCLAMRTQQSTKTVHLILLLLCMCAFFYFYPSFGDLRSAICDFMKFGRTNGITCALQPPRGEVNDNRTSFDDAIFSRIFIYSGTVVAAENGRLQTGFVGGTESRVQQEDRLAYRDHTHHGESNIGGSRLLSIRSPNFTTISFTRNRNVHNRKMTRLSNLERFRRGNDLSRH